MEELYEFYADSHSENSQIVKLRGPLTSGLRLTKEDTTNQLDRKEEHRRSRITLANSTDYCRKVKEREYEYYLKNELDRCKGPSQAGGLNALEQLSTIDGSIINQEQLTDEVFQGIYSKYSFEKKEDPYKTLPINAYKAKVMEGMHINPVVIVEGPTGCGKTTQIPQWILDDCYQKRLPCKIIVTQPRRIAAISIAKRVAEERGWRVGDVVGYQVALENKTTADTRISYVTTGVLLEKLVGAKTLNEYTHIVLDEIHERGQEMDFLLIIVKKLLYTVSPKVKLILMSATFNTTVFSEYFTMPTTTGPQSPVCVVVDKNATNFTVKTHYLNHLSSFSMITTEVNSNEPAIMPEMYHLAVKLIGAFDEIDTKEDNIVNMSKASLPSVLVFLPGINEIEQLYLYLMDKELRTKLINATSAEDDWLVLPLHSTITQDEQARVFVRSPPGQRKIILTTNIAESSITVPDVKYVIDFCLSKILVADEYTNFTSLQLTWASKANCEQRAGRTGRVRDGRVYRLVYSAFYDQFDNECTPEITRSPLERLVLLAKMLDMGQPHEILALAMNPPDLSNIERTILVLKEVGALKRDTDDDDICYTDGEITSWGRVMAKLPLDIRVSKLILLGYIFGCMKECTIIAAALSVRNIFNNPFRERMNAYKSKLTWADGSTSDCIALLNVYRVWSHMRKQRHFQQPGSNERAWARSFYVQVRGLHELDDMLRDVRMRLSREGFEAPDGPSPWPRSELNLVLKIVIAGAFYPHYFVTAPSDETRERDAVRALSGHDPRNTVYLTNFPTDQPGELYAGFIRNAMKTIIGHEPRVIFDSNCSKVYLTFSDDTQDKSQGSGDPTIPGQVLLPIYKAIKARHLRINIRVPLLPLEQASALAETLKREKEDKRELNMDTMVPRFPDVDESHFPLKISQFVHVSKFWAQYDDDATKESLTDLQAELNCSKLLAYTDTPATGAVLAAPYTDASGTAFHRARILRLLPKDMLEVSYIDYGSVGRVHKSNLRQLPSNGACEVLPPLAMECRLAGLEPAPLLDAHAHWSQDAITFFTSVVKRGPLIGRVYSVSFGVVSVELMADNGKMNINKALLDKGYAIPREESYESKLNHDLRQMSELSRVQIAAFNREQSKLASYHLQEAKTPNTKDCVTDVHLKGPFSPLETTIHSTMYSSREKKANIDGHSVNSVLLDNNPQELSERLVVACSVSQNEASSKLSLYNTTFMPNIPGLPAIIALLFCPVAELRRSADRVRYVSALCGLGSSSSGAPHFPEHDLLIDIDADLAVDDIGLINHIRHVMDFVMSSGEEQHAQTPNRQNFPKMIREDLMKLLHKRRKQQMPQVVARAWEWRSVPEDELLEITVPDLMERAVLYPLHAPLELHPRSREQLRALHVANQKLHASVSRTSLASDTQLQCELCGTLPMPAHAMRIHLYSNAHKVKEEEFSIFQS